MIQEDSPAQEEIANLFNDIFCLDLDWSFTDAKTYSLKELQAFDDLCEVLARKLMSSKFEAAIWLLSHARHLVRSSYNANSADEDHLFDPLTLNQEQKQRLADLLSYPALDESFDLIANAFARGETLGEMFAMSDTPMIFDRFLRAERRSLRRSGLNQRSVAIILDRLDHHGLRIVKNIDANRGVRSIGWDPALAPLITSPRYRFGFPTGTRKTSRYI